MCYLNYGQEKLSTRKQTIFNYNCISPVDIQTDVNILDFFQDNTSYSKEKISMKNPFFSTYDSYGPKVFFLRCVI
jgi:hypothetical protein